MLRWHNVFDEFELHWRKIRLGYNDINYGGSQVYFEVNLRYGT